MSKNKVSKEGKKFRDQYIIGNVHLPIIASTLLNIRKICMSHDVGIEQVQQMFIDEGYFYSTNYADLSVSVGKGNTMYFSLNRGCSIIPFQIHPTHSITQVFKGSGNCVQYPMRKTPIFTRVDYNTDKLELPDGLDIMNLPDESLFQLELCIDSRLLHGAATWMGLRDAEYNSGEMIYYGESLLKMKRLEAVIIKVFDEISSKVKA